MLNPVTRVRQHRFRIDRDRLQVRRQQRNVLWRQSCQKAVTNSAATGHSG